MKSAARDLPAWGISLVANLAILGPLHFIVMRHEVAESAPVAISTAVTELEQEPYQFSSELDEQVSAGGGGGGGGGLVVANMAVASVGGVGSVDATPQRRIEQALAPTPTPVGMSLNLPYTSQVASVVERVGPATENITAGGIAGAMDRVSFEIAASLHERQTLVIWLFDASQSQNDRREAIARRFENVYRQLEAMGAYGEGRKGREEERSIHGLYTAVASFQKTTTLMTPQPVEEVAAIFKAVREIKPDPETPEENVFSAVRLVMDKWEAFHRGEGRWNKLIFIVTDEKGENADALANLEDAINIAKRKQFRVYVAGNAAVFGQEKGIVNWKYPEDGFVGPVEVDQGPESAFPTVLQLPFWGSGQVRMSAGYGPYALTRLTAETGGMYLITEDTTSITFDPARMREYMPDYSPIRQQEQQIRANPAMAALVETARQTYLDSIPLPTLLFSAENDTQLRQAITAAQRPVAETEYWVDRMYAMLKQGAAARDSLTEPRWRASFDLAMGRLLAMKVRLKGYNLMLARMKSSPQPFQNKGSNEWRLVADKQIDTGPEIRQAGEEARKLLKRVVDEHPGTPWERLAARELGQDVGWAWREGMHYVAGMENRTDVDQEQVRLLLADEQQRRERRKITTKERPKPNL